MRTSLEFPDPLFRTLKATAAMRGVSLRDHVLGLIERGMAAGPVAAAAPQAAPRLPCISTQVALGSAITADTTNADLMALLDET